MVTVEVTNRSGEDVPERAATELALRVLDAEGVEAGELGVVFVTAAEMRRLKREHLGIDEATDVLSFPIDGREDGQPGVPRQIGDVVLCTEVVGEAWRGPLVHGLLHVLGLEHGAAMRARERRYAEER